MSSIPKKCKIDQCSNRLVAKGLCSTHYSRLRLYGDANYKNPNYIRRGDICTVDVCYSKQYAKLYCTKHYNRYLTTGSPTNYLPKYTNCTLEDCSNKHYGRGYCAKHWARTRAHGSPYIVLNIKQGRVKHPMYTRYRGMIDRCYYKKSHKYYRYGARGIKVCAEWLDKSVGFEKYVGYVENLDNAHKQGWTLDRIDNDGDYEPGNIRWASPETQANNQERIINKGE